MSFEVCNISTAELVSSLLMSVHLSVNNPTIHIYTYAIECNGAHAQNYCVSTKQGVSGFTYILTNITILFKVLERGISTIFSRTLPHGDHHERSQRNSKTP
jgi:hypothetical protein